MRLKSLIDLFTFTRRREASDEVIGIYREAEIKSYMQAQISPKARPTCILGLYPVGRGGALVESKPFDRRVLGSNIAVAPM